MKKILSVMLAAVLICGLLAGCGKATNSENAKTRTESINGYTFQVLNTWKNGDNSDDMQYYYPKQGMLMVSYSDMSQSISDDNVSKSLIQGYASGTDSFKLISDEKIKVVGSEGRRYEMRFSTAGKDWEASMVAFDCDSGVICFMMATLQKANVDYTKNFENILSSIKATGGAASQGTKDNQAADAETVSKQVEVKAVPTLDGLMCVFIKNNSNTVIDELEVQLNYKDGSGTIIDAEKDGHDMVLPGSTVVSRIDAPQAYSDFEVETSVKLGVNPKYENHSADVAVSSNQGDKCIIVELQNNAKVPIDEIEYTAVLYKGDQIVTVEYPKDVMDVAVGQKITEKIDTYDKDYDRFEIYLNQAHTFGL